VLEEIRLLSNVDDERGTMLQIVLVGQGDMEPLLARPELRQIQQRVSRRLRIDPLTADELEQYITHRMKVASGALTRAEMPGATELEREMAEWDSGAIADRTPRFTADGLQSIWELSAGIPRVVNIVCDRALEAAYEREVRTIDAAVVQKAASLVGLAGPPPLQQGADRREQAVPVAFVEPAEESTASPDRKRLAIVAVLLVAVVGGWLAFRALNAPASDANANANADTDVALSSPPAAVTPTPPAAPPPAAADPVPTPAAQAAPSTPLPSSQAAPPPAAAIPPPPTPARTAIPPPPASGAERFEIVVASFRTTSRATSVAAEVTALGLPVRRRVANGWQQVLAGPFASRAEADRAQQRLAGAGITGTQIVTAS
jgi:general secretion pathway protein A